jgi:hypothetical protein
MYKIALFLHVTGALLLCAAITIEWVCIINMRKADGDRRLGESLFYFPKVKRMGDIAALLLLIPGIYMMIAVWNDASWAIVGFIGLMFIGAIGGTVTGRKMKKVRAIIKMKNADPHQLQELLNGNTLWISIQLRTAILLGVIFLMTVKPGLTESILTMVLSIVLGALPLRMRNISLVQ